MMIAGTAVFFALAPRDGGEPRIKSQDLQTFTNVIIMLVIIFGAIFAFGVD